jgi:hypothetical protein
MKLTGFQRFQLTRIWFDTKREEFPNKEDFISTVCKRKGIEYVPPVDLESARNVTKSAKMFPAYANKK